MPIKYDTISHHSFFDFAKMKETHKKLLLLLLPFAVIRNGRLDDAALKVLIWGGSFHILKTFGFDKSRRNVPEGKFFVNVCFSRKRERKGRKELFVEMK